MTQPQKQKADRRKETAPTGRRPGPMNTGPAALLEGPDLLALQRALAHPEMARAGDIRALQRAVGNRALKRRLKQVTEREKTRTSTVQKNGRDYEMAVESVAETPTLVRAPQHLRMLATFKGETDSIAQEVGGIWPGLRAKIIQVGDERVGEGTAMLAKFLLYDKYAGEICKILRGTNADEADELDKLLSYGLGGSARDNWSADFYGDLAEFMSFDDILDSVVKENLRLGKKKIEQVKPNPEALPDDFLAHWFMNDKGYMNNAAEH